jgi:site-specific DNA-methyltransferase (adenine-specific)
MQAWHERWATECLRVLKPGGHLLAFGGTRTYHRMVCAIEDAGFEVRDSIDWLYGSGFPKSLDVSKAIDKMGGDPAAAEWDGWGTALKPAHEPIVVARKPLVGTVVANVLAHGTGALNIDACRIGSSKDVPAEGSVDGSLRNEDGTGSGHDRPRRRGQHVGGVHGAGGACGRQPLPNTGRWPANFVLTHSAGCRRVGEKVVHGSESRGVGDERPSYRNFDGTETLPVYECVEGCPVAALDAQSGTLRARGNVTPTVGGGGMYGHPSTVVEHGPGDAGGASRFFAVTEWDPDYDVPFLYAAKASRSERNEGLDALPDTNTFGPMAGRGQPGLSKCGRWKVSGSPCVCPLPEWEPSAFERPPVKNDHPTVKPVALMRWLVRLVTPPGGLVLDPFLGSGTTGVAAVLEGFDFVGVEKDTEHGYLDIARARIEHAQNAPVGAPRRAKTAVRPTPDPGQPTLF